MAVPRSYDANRLFVAAVAAIVLLLIAGAIWIARFHRTQPAYEDQVQDGAP
jgi:hypothetical protein